MSELICGKCILCCQWSGEKAIRPELIGGEGLLLKSELITKIVGTQVKLVKVLAANEVGHCIYLGDKGCTVYEERPQVCRAFDCRKLYDDSKEATFIKVLFRGKQLLEKPSSR